MGLKLVDINVSTLSSFNIYTCSVPVEQENDINLCVHLEQESDISSEILSEYSVDAPIEQESEVSLPTVFKSSTASFIENENGITGDSFLSNIILSTIENESEVLSSVYQNFFVDKLLESDHDFSSLIVAAYINTEVIENENKVSIISFYGHTSSIATEHNQEVVSQIACKFIETISIEHESIIETVSLLKYITTCLTESETGLSKQTLINLISSIPTENENTFGLIFDFSSISADFIYKDLMLGLFGKKLEPMIFSNFKFDSFLSENGKAYGIMSDGIYLINKEIEKDEGRKIVPFVKIDFRKMGTNYQKQIRRICTDNSKNCIVDFDSNVKKYTATTNGVFNCTRTHRGKKLKTTIVDFDSLSDVEFFFYNLARKR